MQHSPICENYYQFPIGKHLPFIGGLDAGNNNYKDHFTSPVFPHDCLNFSPLKLNGYYLKRVPQGKF